MIHKFFSLFVAIGIFLATIGAWMLFSAVWDDLRRPPSPKMTCGMAEVDGFGRVYDCKFRSDRCFITDRGGIACDFGPR